MKINEKNKIIYLTMVKGVSNSQDAFMDAGCINTGMVSSDTMEKLLNKLPQKPNGKKIVVFVVTDYGEYVEVLKNKYGDFCDIYCIPTSYYGYRLCMAALRVYVDNPEKFVIFDKTKLQSIGLCNKYLKHIMKNKNMNADIADIIKDGGELYCIQNPPYQKSLHLDFLEMGLELINKFNGKMVIIEPATWLINVRKNGNTVKKYDAIKNKINGHVESVVIENLNKEFNVTQSMPFAITTIDMSKTIDTINFYCCGEHKVVNSIYDCNLVGKYNTIWSIFEKVQSFKSMMKAHITNEDKGREYWYSKCVGIGKDSLISGSGAALCGATNERVGMSYDSTALWSNTTNGEYLTPYTSIGYHYYNNEISNKPLYSYDRGKKLTNKISWNVFGTKNEIENWKSFIFTNKLPLFINICLTDNQHNNSIDFLPWLVDKQYTDDEINKLFGFTDEEIKLIDTTIKKYERNSPWFKRYMCGKNGATDEEVTEYIKKITEEC